uniref:Methylated-DNA--protein-cysteine methyltransferase n=1 Tax=Psilocybe cubensis TaxID=181762 RepID=A0A8H7XKA4_PSICU
MPVERVIVELPHHHHSRRGIDHRCSVTSRFFPARDHQPVAPDPDDETLSIYYPRTSEDRVKFRTKSGKKLTPHQWAVYDFVKTIPKGRVATYKDVAYAAGGSPRSVGGALRNNPFSPYVPCHRIIASNLFVGGFFGEWGKDHKTGTRYSDKISLLSQEGVQFDNSGHLLEADNVLWRR